MRQDLLDREGNPWDFLVSDHFLILNYDFIGTCTYYSTTVCARSMKAYMYTLPSLEIWQGSYPFSYPQDVLGMLLADLDYTPVQCLNALNGRDNLEGCAQPA